MSYKGATTWSERQAALVTNEPRNWANRNIKEHDLNN